MDIESSSPSRCPKCGTDLPHVTPEGLCPRCLLGEAVAPRSTLVASSSPAPTQSSTTQRIGPYRLDHILGEGGMGTVWRATQEKPVRRVVALKVIKLGMDTRDVIARFESERQALALMDHPNIARVLDAGASDWGRPYFVMEYVPGIPITEYCDRHRLTCRDRLQLFCDVCFAIHHAHQKGIIHRDIKPSNILVEVLDRKPTPKVIDFGVAKAISQRLTEKTLVTAVGALVGTPAYMSPEQAGATTLDVDTTTDIYSLGVLLYEFLTGALPFDPEELRKKGYAETCRMIREEDPPKLATKLECSAEATEVAKRRQADVRTLLHLMRGDLEWITMKALEKDRTRRYASASELAADVQRHLNNEPVSAGPHSAAYRLRKSLRRHKGPFIAASFVVLSLLIGLGVSFMLYLRSEIQRKQAEFQGYVAALNAGDAHLRANDIPSAAANLFSIGFRPRGWEWRHLYNRLNSNVLSLYAYHANSDISLLTFSADGSRLTWATREIVHVWDGTTFARIGDYGGFGRIVGASHDGALVLVREDAKLNDNDWSSSFRVVDPMSGKSIAEFIERATSTPAPNSVCAFSTDNRRIAIGWDDGMLHVWEIKPHRRVLTSTVPSSPIRALIFSPDGSSIATGGDEGKIRVWDLSSGTLRPAIAGHAGSITALAFSDSGERIASGSADRTVRVWDVRRAALLGTITGHDGTVTSVAFSSDRRSIVSGSTDRSVRIWDADNLGPIATLTGNHFPVSAVTFNRDGTKVLSASTLTLISVWETPFGRAPVSRTPWFDTKLSGDASRAMSGDVLHGVQVTNTRSGRLICQWRPSRAATAAAISSDGGRIYTDGELRDASTCQRVTLFHEFSNIRLAALNSSGTRLLTNSSNPGRIEMWDAPSGRQLWSRELREEGYSATFSPDGSRFVFASAVPPRRAEESLGSEEAIRYREGDDWVDPPTTDDTAVESDIRIYETDSGTPLARMRRSRGWVRALAFSPDGKRVSAGYREGRIQVWDALRGEVLGLSRRHSGMVTAIGYNRDGTRMVSGSSDLTLRIWDASRFEPLLTLRGHTAWVTGIAFTPDGSRIVSVDREGGVRAWEATPQHIVNAAERVSSLFRETNLSAEVVQSLQSDSSLDNDTRQAAVQIAQGIGDDPLALNDESWRVVRSPEAPLQAYRKAVERASTAQRLRPWRTQYLTTLGAAQYRTGNYREALETLSRAMKAHNNSLLDLAFLAMTLQRLGRLDEARSTLRKLEVLAMDLIGSARDRDVQNCIHEARQAVNGLKK